MQQNSVTTDGLLTTVGSPVAHRALGAGVVSRVERGGRWVWVLFEQNSSLPFRVRVSELERTKRRPKRPQTKTPEPAKSTPVEPQGAPRRQTAAANATSGRPEVVDSGPRHRALGLLEALRLGVVPHGQTSQYTVGREAELQAVLSMLDPTPGPSGRVRIVEGDYGTGKTHLLECIRDVALGRGFAVAAVTLDGREVTPAHPRRIYRRLVRSLRLPGQREVGGLRPLFDTLLTTRFVPRPSHKQGGHRYLDPAFLYYAALAEEPALQELLVDWIEGQPGEWSDELNKQLRRHVPGPRLLALPDFRTFGSIYAYLLGGIAYLCQKAGAQGLCLLIDEAEFYAALGAENRGYADEVFGCYALACLPDGEARQGADQVKKGGQAVHRSLPLRFRPDQPLACVFFVTPDPAGLEALGRWVNLDKHRITLEPLSQEHYQELYHRAYAIYRAAHPNLALPESVAQPMGEFLHAALAAGVIRNPRAALKLLIELFDICRLSPARLKAVMDDLRRLFAHD